MFYVYVLQNQQGRFYIGYTADLKRRIKEHTAKHVMSTKTSTYELLYYEAYRHKMDAVMREKFLKSGSGHRYIHVQLRHALSEKIVITRD